MARPKKDPAERRVAHLPAVRVTQAELAALSLQASHAGLSLSDFIRQRALSGKVTPKRGLADAQLLSELNSIGVNLNQIARQLNRGRDRDPHHLDHVLGLLVSVLEGVGRRV